MGMTKEGRKSIQSSCPFSWTSPDNAPCFRFRGLPGIRNGVTQEVSAPVASDTEIFFD